MVWFTSPMWPDIFLPGNTRPGVWRWPIEPGERCDSELPWRRVAHGEVPALDRALEALALGDALDVDDLADLEDVALISPPTSLATDRFGAHAEFPQAAAAFHLRLGEVAGEPAC